MNSKAELCMGKQEEDQREEKGDGRKEKAGSCIGFPLPQAHLQLGRTQRSRGRNTLGKDSAGVLGSPLL